MSDLITKTPGVCGGKACIAGTGIPVWVVWQIVRGLKNAYVAYHAVLQAYPGVTYKQMVRSVEYVAQHGDEIERDIKANEEVTTDEPGT